MIHLFFINLLVIYCICTTPLLVMAQALPQCSAPTAQETVRIYYANGMMNSPSKAQESRDELIKTLGIPKANFGLSYNANENWIKEFLQVLHQRNNASKDFW
jgi:hypothetical protein